MAAQNATEFTNAELLEAQAHVWNHIYSYIFSMSLKAAIQLQIPDVIYRHGKPMTLSQLANSLPINKAKTQYIRRLMRILTNSKIFIIVKTAHCIDEEKDQEEEEEAYGLTVASRLLIQGEPMSLSSYALAMINPVSIDPWHRLSEWFGDERELAFATEHGMTMWELAGIDQKYNLLFNESMASDSQLVNRVLARECRHVFQGLTSMVDVGGGTGMVAKAVAEEFPGLKCTVLDLPHVVDGLKDAHNLSFVSGDMFKSVPPADAVLLKWILHDWGDEESVKILQKCREAILPGNQKEGKVIILEMVVIKETGDSEESKPQLLFDMQMMVEKGGKERSEKEWAKLFIDAGFTRYQIHPVLGLRSVIEVFP